MTKPVFLRFCAAALLSASLLSACGGTDPEPTTPTDDAGVETDAGTGGTTDGGETGDGGDGSDGGTGNPNTEDPVIVPDPAPDPGPMPTNPNGSNNANLDTDCDGLTDAEEFASVYGPQKLKTDPGVRDTDGDGIRDGVEVGRTSTVNTAVTCTFYADKEPASRTSPVLADTDGDGLKDGMEDLNRDGKRDPSETDPSTSDSDADGLADGTEDANRNAVVSPGETDPRKRDTDEDTIPDGRERNTTKTDPLKPDTDGDGCRDAEEDKNQNGAKDTGESDPKVAGDCGGTQNPDADGDGIPDAIETATSTDKTKADTDGDGLGDGVEDKNRNGRVDTGETNPRTKDTDCDGLQDGPAQASFKGEDLNGNGTRESAETDPANPDTDGDGLLDGVERGVATASAPVTTCGYKGDADPNTTTGPVNADSDGDGIPDGAEDNNQDGKKDPNELDPNSSSDGATGTPAGQACAANLLRPVTFKAEGEADIQLALPATFTEVSTLTQGTQKRGLMGYDDTNKVAFFVYREAARGNAKTAAEHEAALRPTLTLGGTAALSNVLTQSFRTWDQYDAASGRYDQAGTVDLKARANALATALVGSGVSAFSGSAAATGPFRIEMQYVYRSANSVVVLVALAPQARMEGNSLFTVRDTAGGSALAQFGDSSAVQCESFTASTSKVDILFVVDDSCSMDASQDKLASTADAVATRLNNSTLDYRLGLVTSNYHVEDGKANAKVLRGFTRNINLFRAWLTKDSTCVSNVCSKVPTTPTPATCSTTSVGAGANNGCWVGTGGTGNEGILGAARKVVNDITPALATDPVDGVANRVRKDADLVVILLGDADDQTTGESTTAVNCGANGSATSAGTECEAASNFTEFFNAVGARANKLGERIPVHGIICPTGARCNNEFNPVPQRHGAVIDATGGIKGAINDLTSIEPAIKAIIDDTIGRGGYITLKPPIGASMKVAMASVRDSGVCNPNDVPRSRQNGFDFDGQSRSISLFGACRAPAAGTQAAVSYRYWVDSNSPADGAEPPCSTDSQYYDPNDPDFCKGKLVCNEATNLCECPANCGGGGQAGQVCNTDRAVCAWQCAPDCGGTCGAFKTCDQNTCACSCVQSATCAPGFKFDTNACGCVCDTAALGCGSTYNVDANSCACVCKPNCGGCPTGQTCNTSYCTCQGGIN